jgi:hypothetical protein
VECQTIVGSYRRPRAAQPEQQIQRAVFEHLAIRAASTVFAFHPANGGWRSRVEAAILKGMGVRSRCPGHHRHQERPVLRARTQRARRPSDTRSTRCPCGARCGRRGGRLGREISNELDAPQHPTAANGKVGGPLTQLMRKKIYDGGFETPYRLRKPILDRASAGAGRRPVGHPAGHQP